MVGLDIRSDGAQEGADGRCPRGLGIRGRMEGNKAGCISYYAWVEKGVDEAVRI
jgi:hypothetical protein